MLVGYRVVLRGMKLLFKHLIVQDICAVQGATNILSDFPEERPFKCIYLLSLFIYFLISLFISCID